MKRIFLASMMIMAALWAVAREQSYCIEFGAATASTSPLTNATFGSAIAAGASYIDHVTSVVAVYPEKESIKLSSQKTNGKFNIHLAEGAQVVASRIVVEAWRYDNDRDLEASLTLNGETMSVPSPEPEYYSLSIPSRPERILTNLIVDAGHRLYIKAIHVYYDDAQGSVDPDMATVATPVISPAGGSVTSGTTATISCSTEGAAIYYTIDGSEPSTSSAAYTAPVALYHDLRLRAFAVKDGFKPSAEADVQFTVRNPEAELTSVFDFSRPETLNPAVAAPAVKEWVELDGRSFSDGDVALTFTAAEDGNTHVRLYGSYDNGTDLRLYNGDAVRVSSLNEAYTISGINVEISHSGSDADAWFIASEGEWVWETDSWRPSSEAARTVDLTSYQQSRLAKMTVTLERSGQSRVAGIESAPAAEPVYYNLQGMPVAYPSTGVYIRITDGKADKTIIRR